MRRNDLKPRWVVGLVVGVAFIASAQESSSESSRLELMKRLKIESSAVDPVKAANGVDGGTEAKEVVRPGRSRAGGQNTFVLAVRPQRMRLGEPGPDAIPLTVFALEHLGNESIVIADAPPKYR